MQTESTAITQQEIATLVATARNPQTTIVDLTDCFSRMRELEAKQLRLRRDNSAAEAHIRNEFLRTAPRDYYGNPMGNIQDFMTHYAAVYTQGQDMRTRADAEAASHNRQAVFIPLSADEAFGQLCAEVVERQQRIALIDPAVRALPNIQSLYLDAQSPAPVAPAAPAPVAAPANSLLAQEEARLKRLHQQRKSPIRLIKNLFKRVIIALETGYADNLFRDPDYALHSQIALQEGYIQSIKDRSAADAVTSAAATSATIVNLAITREDKIREALIASMDRNSLAAEYAKAKTQYDAIDANMNGQITQKNAAETAPRTFRPSVRKARRTIIQNSAAALQMMTPRFLAYKNLKDDLQAALQRRDSTGPANAPSNAPSHEPRRRTGTGGAPTAVAGTREHARAL